MGRVREANDRSTMKSAGEAYDDGHLAETRRPGLGLAAACIEMSARHR